MPKTKQQKQGTIESLSAGLKGAKGIVFANFQGLTVAKTEELRKIARKEGVTVLAAKKTLVKRALEDAGFAGIDTTAFDGGVATFYAADEIASAKVVATFAKKNDIVKIFGGILEGKFVDAGMVKSLSALPSKHELLSKMVGSLQAPIAGFVRVNAGVVRSLVNVLNAYKEKKA